MYYNGLSPETQMHENAKDVFASDCGSSVSKVHT